MYWIPIAVIVFICAFLLIRGMYSRKEKVPEEKKQGADEASVGVGDSDAGE